MSKGPGLFSVFGKKARDLLAKDYGSEQRISIFTYSDTGVALTSNVVNKGGHSTGDVGALYKYKNTLIDVKVDTESNISTTLTLNDIVPSTKTIAFLKFSDYMSGKLEVQYFDDHAAFSTSLDVKQSPIVDFSVALGSPTFAIGAEASYETAEGKLVKYTAGISVTKPNSCAAIILGDKWDTIKASYIHHLDESKKSAAVGEITRRFSTKENTFTVGGSYAIDPLTTVKGKLNHHGRLGALLQHEVIPKSSVIISTEFDVKTLEKAPRLGMAFAFKP